MKKSTVVLSAVNILAMLYLLGFVWSVKDLALMEGRDSYDVGDSFGFLLIVAPVLLLCLIADIIWAGTALLSVVRRRGYQAAVACAVVLAMWIAVFLAARGLANLPSDSVLQQTTTAPPER